MKENEKETRGAENQIFFIQRKLKKINDNHPLLSVLVFSFVGIGMCLK
jgi:hypothetical protein